jgi:hypothetical protein
MYIGAANRPFCANGDEYRDGRASPGSSQILFELESLKTILNEIRNSLASVVTVGVTALLYGREITSVRTQTRWTVITLCDQRRDDVKGCEAWLFPVWELAWHNQK